MIMIVWELKSVALESFKIVNVGCVYNIQSIFRGTAVFLLKIYNLCGIITL